MGILLKDTSSGPFIDEWKKVYGDISKQTEEIDIAPALSASALAIKDENELVCAAVLDLAHSAHSLLACYAKCLESLRCSHEPLLR